MAIRGEIYEWELIGKELTLADTPTAGQEYSIFTSGYGTADMQTSLVAEDSFVVINKISCTTGVSPNQYELDGTELIK